MSDYKESIEELKKLVSNMSAKEISMAKDLFEYHLAITFGNVEEFKNILSKWHDAVMALPKTNLLEQINAVQFEITIDVLKRARSYYSCVEEFTERIKNYTDISKSPEEKNISVVWITPLSFEFGKALRIRSEWYLFIPDYTHIPCVEPALWLPE